MTFKPNAAQLRIMLALVRIMVNIWPRGQGKTNAIAFIIDTVVHLMPRGTTLFLGRTFVDMNINIIPEIKKGLGQRGYFEGIHYFDGKKPPETMGYPQPISPLKEYDRCFYWYTGHIIIFASQDRPGSNRGGSVDFIIIDEMLNIKKEGYEKEILPKRRGNNDVFGHIPLHHGIFACSSKPIGADSQWIYSYGDYYKEDYIHYEGQIKELTDLELEFIDSNDRARRVDLWADIMKIQKEIRWYPKNQVYYNECRVWNNIDNLKFQYIKEQRRVMSTTHFRVEILNDYFVLLENAFYPTFQESVHVDRDTYNYDTIDKLDITKAVPMASWHRDYDPGQPIYIGQDYGVNINYLLAVQVFGSEIRFIKEFFVKPPKWTKDVAQQFCDYYCMHKRRTIYYHYDHTGNNRQPNMNKLSDECVEVFRKNGWTVIKCTFGAAVDPDYKFQLLHRTFKEDVNGEWYIRINGNQCPNLVTSIKLSPVKQTNRGLAKDKSSEDPRKGIPQEIATHASDTMDIVVCGIIKNKHQSTFIDVSYR